MKQHGGGTRHNPMRNVGWISPERIKREACVGVERGYITVVKHPGSGWDWGSVICIQLMGVSVVVLYRT